MRNSITQSSHNSTFFFFLFLWVILWNGCTASSPRFRSNASPAIKTETARPQQQHPTREVEEETRENDKPVDIGSAVPPVSTSSIENPEIDQKKMMDEVLSMLGTPYSFSGTDSNGIDCSGFTAKVYANAVEKQLPHSTADQYAICKPVEENSRAFGDLLFFNTTGESPSHVGIYLGEDLFAHASVSSGVTISSLESSYYKKRYIGARRVIY